MMAWLRITQKCAAGGRHLAQGQVLAVPDELPVQVANALARMGRGELLDAPPDLATQPAKPARTRKARAEETE